MTCSTTHYACDCQMARIRELESSEAALRNTVERLIDFGLATRYGDNDDDIRFDLAVRKAKEALSTSPSHFAKRVEYLQQIVATFRAFVDEEYTIPCDEDKAALDWLDAHDAAKGVE